MGSRILIGVAIVAILALGVWYYTQGPSIPPAGGQSTTTPGETHKDLVYASTTQMIRFEYPDSYQLEERDQGTGAGRQHIITLMRKTDLPPPQNGEGPVSINIQIFPVSGQTLQNWVKNVQDSNFNLSPDKELTTTTVAGVEGVKYRWSGLYEGESIALLRGGRVYIFSHTWLEREGELREDFEHVLDSVTFTWE